MRQSPYANPIVSSSSHDQSIGFA